MPFIIHISLYYSHLYKVELNLRDIESDVEDINTQSNVAPNDRGIV